MAFDFFRFLRPKDGQTRLELIQTRELFDAAVDYQIRELAWWTCVNWIADAVGRCEIRTYRAGEEIQEREYWMWNYEPNLNQNSTAFWHKAIARLFEDGELLIVPVRRRDGLDSFVVADDWEDPEGRVSRMNEYRGVTVDGFTFDKTFREDDVLHLRLNHVDMKPVILGVQQSWMRLVKAAMDAYGWQNGQHWKVHVDQIAGGKEGWAESFQQMIAAQIKPFLNSGAAVLPEFDGYKYERVNSDGGVKDAQDLRRMVDDILTFTARGCGIPDVILSGSVEATGDAMKRALSFAVDPICDQFAEEATRKRYGFDGWKRGDYLRMDSSAILHFDLFGNAAGIEKLLGAGWSLNDIRRAAGESPIKEPFADQHFLTKNIGQMAAAEGAQEGGTT